MELVAIRMKEVRSAKREVESAIRLFGPANITSILDHGTFGDKLAAITVKLEMYMKKTEDVIEELEELKDSKEGTETECDRRVDEINTLTEVIVKKVNDNECEVKKKIEAVIREFKDNRDSKTSTDPSDSKSSTKPPQLPRNQSMRTGTTEQPIDRNEPANEDAANEDAAEEGTPDGNPAATVLLQSITAALPVDEQAKTVINQVAAAVVPAAAEAIPGLDQLLPNVVSVFRLFQGKQN
eukprot:GFUD01025147.1.p1 GENE.GFUD01025147.1~~GFUD01025147.1.p1  ORF type:complete len:239 (+),score=97.38 GFUD01025147.1:61-777(+)